MGTLELSKSIRDSCYSVGLCSTTLRKSWIKLSHAEVYLLFVTNGGYHDVLSSEKFSLIHMIQNQKSKIYLISCRFVRFTLPSNIMACSCKWWNMEAKRQWWVAISWINSTRLFQIRTKYHIPCALDLHLLWLMQALWNAVKT